MALRPCALDKSSLSIGRVKKREMTMSVMIYTAYIVLYMLECSSHSTHRNNIGTGHQVVYNLHSHNSAYPIHNHTELTI